MKDTDRSYLRDVLPLEAPYLVQIFPCYGCNFHCKFCLHALPKEQHGYVSDARLMDIELYKRAIDDIASAWGKIKMLRFAAIGEPLLHPQIADMVAYAKKRDVAERIDIVTNASLLKPELSDQLIAGGLSTLRISIEGLSAEEYLENCGVSVDFDNLVSNLRYYYEHSAGSRVYIKIIDYMLKSDPDRERRFYDLFKGICHDIAVEHLTPTVENIDYSAFSGETDFSLTQDGVKRANVNICPQPFYMLQINPDGTLVPCCSTRYPVVIRDERMSEAWNGKELTDFRLSMLYGKKNDVCASCTLYQYGTYPEDILDGSESWLAEKYMNLRN